METFDFQEIESFDELSSLRPAWSQLWDRCRSATVFQSPEWLLPWARNMFEGGSLLVIALRLDRCLVAVAPLFIWGHDCRTVSMLGAGISDYSEFLSDPEVEPSATAAIFQHLLRRRSKWDVCEWDQVPQTSLQGLQQAMPAGLESALLESTVCPVLELPSSWEALQARLPSKFKTDIRRSRNRMARSAGGLQLEAANSETLPAYLQEFFDLHRARWEVSNQPGMLATSRLQSFHCEAARECMNRGMLRLWRLPCDGRAAAFVYAFARHPRVWAYLGAFEPSMARLSPGSVVMSLAIEAAITEGFSYFDFLRDKEEFKYLWGARDRVNHRLLIWHSDTPRGFVARRLDAACVPLSAQPC